MNPTTRAAVIEALGIAVRQNGHDMLMTGEELRKCEAALQLLRSEPEPTPEPTRWAQCPETETPCSKCPTLGVQCEAAQAEPVARDEPVAVYHGRCTIDCGEHGHHDLELLKMIPKGSKLYTKAAVQSASDLRGTLETLKNRLDASVELELTAREAYDSFYRELVDDALAARASLPPAPKEPT
jgi:hypothetical protein